MPILKLKSLNECFVKKRLDSVTSGDTACKMPASLLNGFFIIS